MPLSLHEQNAAPDNATQDMYVARQPVFDTEMRVWGYELLFRQNASSSVAEIEDQDVATAQVMLNGFSLAAEWLSPRQKVLINYPENLLLQGMPHALPALLFQPMPEIVGKLSMAPRLAQALLGDEPELQAWLDIALASESGNWSQAETILERLAIGRDTAAKAQNKATSWAKHFMETA